MESMLLPLPIDTGGEQPEKKKKKCATCRKKKRECTHLAGPEGAPLQPAAQTAAAGSSSAAFAAACERLEAAVSSCPTIVPISISSSAMGAAAASPSDGRPTGAAATGALQPAAQPAAAGASSAAFAAACERLEAAVTSCPTIVPISISSPAVGAAAASPSDGRPAGAAATPSASGSVFSPVAAGSSAAVATLATIDSADEPTRRRRRAPAPRFGDEHARDEHVMSAADYQRLTDAVKPRE